MDDKITGKVVTRANTGKYARFFVCLMGVLYAVAVVVICLNPAKAYSQTERRTLAQRPEFDFDDLRSGKYVQRLEKYMVDQFPVRDELRTVKSNFSMKMMGKQDVHNIYVKDGYLCKMEYPMDEESVLKAARAFENLYGLYISDTDIKPYAAVVPDKNYFLADEGVLVMDYDAFIAKFHEETPLFTPVSIIGYLELSDYYRTDTHWKQEAVIDVAAALAESMNVPFDAEFTVNKADVPFYGVYYGQAGLNLPPDEISYCTNELLEKCRVYDFEHDKEIPLYNTEALTGRDPYEMFLGGNISLATIENEEALSDKELVVFGDSFSRSLLPLLAGSYQKITLLDIRYLSSAQVGRYVEFTDQDVLFLYSTSVLNNAITLK